MNTYFPEIKGIDIQKLLISSVGKYSVSKPEDSQQTNNIISSYFKEPNKIIITDATANNGGNTIRFALEYQKVNSVEISKEQFDILKNNVDVYGFKNVSLYNDDYLTIMMKLKQDAIFIDAPWGGVHYHRQKELDLFLGKINIVNVVKQLYDANAFQICCLKVPNNYNFSRLFRTFRNVKMDVYPLEKYIIVVLVG